MPTYSGDITIPSATIFNGITYTVTGIGDNAFKNCANLKSVTIPNTVTTIGKSTFNDCTALSQLAIPASVSAIGNYAFTGCSALKVFTVDGSNESYCSVDGVLHDKAKTKVVAYPNLHGSSYRVIDSVKEIGIGAFNNCPDLTTVIIPDGVTAIGSSAFTHCGKLRVVSIGRGMTSIGSSAFAYCTSMGAVTIPASVTSISGNAFTGCTGLTSVTSLRETPVKINANVFQDVPVATATLLVPDGCSTVYGSTAVWKDFGTIEELPNMKGDVNGDGKVDVKDINIILGMDSKDNYSGADVNGDNKVDIVDLNTIINVILGV